MNQVIANQTMQRFGIGRSVRPELSMSWFITPAPFSISISMRLSRVPQKRFSEGAAGGLRARQRELLAIFHRAQEQPSVNSLLKLPEHCAHSAGLLNGRHP